MISDGQIFVRESNIDIQLANNIGQLPSSYWFDRTGEVAKKRVGERVLDAG